LPFVFLDHVTGFVSSDFLHVDAVAFDDTKYLPFAGDGLSGTYLKPRDAGRSLLRRKKVGFAELKNQIGLGRVRLRRMKHVREQFFLAELETTGSLPKIDTSRISHGPDLR
jgi:hypothetical protein